MTIVFHLLDPNQPDMIPVLAAMTGVCGFLWTGVLILRQLGLRYDNRLRVAGEFLGFGFLAPLLAMICDDAYLRWAFLLAFFAYSWFLFGNIRGLLARRHRLSPTDARSELVYTCGQAAYILAMVAICIWPFPLTVLVCAFAFLFVGFQIVLSKLLVRIEPKITAGLMRAALPLNPGGEFGMEPMAHDQTHDISVLSVVATNTGPIAASNYRLTLYLPESFKEIESVGPYPLLFGQPLVDVEGTAAFETYVEGATLQTTKLHPVSLAMVLIRTPIGQGANGYVHWRFTSNGDFEAEGKQRVSIFSAHEIAEATAANQTQ